MKTLSTLPGGPALDEAVGITGTGSDSDLPLLTRGWFFGLKFDSEMLYFKLVPWRIKNHTNHNILCAINLLHLIYP